MHFLLITVFLFWWTCMHACSAPASILEKYFVVTVRSTVFSRMFLKIWQKIAKRNY